MKKDNFEFWCELNQVEKAIDEKTGEEIMLLGGIASTADEDSDGEFLDPKGFDIRPLLKSGLVNWHHQAKTNPGTIVGEPTKAEIRKEGLYIETQLYPHSQVACDIWELAKTLASDSKTRRLGYSIEGRVVKRKSEDPTSPDYKKIVKAVITGVAITHQPKNPKTFANIIKGDIDDDFEDEEDKKEEIKEKDIIATQEEAVDTETAAALKKESVDDNLKVTTFGKAEVFDKIFHDIAGISVSKAQEIYSIIEKIANMKKNSKAITEEDIQKAYDALGIEAPEVSVIKGEDTEEVDETEETEVEETEENEGDETSSATKKQIKKGEEPESEEEMEEEDDNEPNPEEEIEEEEDEADNNDDEDEDEDEDEKGVKKALMNSFDSRFERIEKAIAASHNSQSKYVKALGVMVKAQSIQLEKAQESLNLALETIESQEEVIKGYESQLQGINEQLAEMGSSVPAAKSIRHAAPVERAFRKGEDNDFMKSNKDELGKNQISATNRSAVAEILDQATFAKGYDEEFSKACTAYEAGAELTANVIARIKNEFGIEIIK